MLNQGPILLVEDDSDSILLMKKAFAAAEITNPLRVVEDGETLMAYLSGVSPYNNRGSYPIPMMILLDLKLPRISGFDLIEWIRKNSEIARLIIVIMTSSREAKDISKAYALGANSYLVKPTSFHDLVDVVKMMKSYWLNHNQFAPSPAQGSSAQ